VADAVVGDEERRRRWRQRGQRKTQMIRIKIRSR
jgi:hypothetical protein